ncbi:MAG: nicotinate phosphoribosyltransferase [Candidatus Omnitrophica bacterium]|nr:nicotinate phosphoribosyltransferase [Candidatus Omnitrophota bacterium]MDD5592916.1 nicotinate phosphoribosyltransferase [Candidatus Omnitrophota bacterium]
MTPQYPNPLLLDLYELTMAQSYFIYRRATLATFDLFVRELPKNRAYLVACGLEDVLNYIRNLRFSKEDLEYLKGRKIFSKDFLRYLSRFRFKGDIWAMPEGSIFFANEPVIRVTASIIEAQIIESFLLNTINLQTMIASKASRVVLAAKGRGVYDFSLRRTHGSDAGIKVGRASFIAGFSGTSCVLAGKLYRIPLIGTMAHSYVMSFKHELDSFLAYANTFPGKTTLIVDTYNTKKGIENAVRIGLYLKAIGHKMQGIRLDSGDIVSLSKLARKMLNQAALSYVKIFASGNLDEFRIKNLLDEGVLADSFGVGTNMGVSIDAPCLDVVYKISEVTGENGKFLPTMKLSRGKITYPSRKQVFRVLGARGDFIKDILGLDKEKIRGRPLLIKVVEKGRIIYKMPSLEKVRAFVRDSLSKITRDLKDIYFKVEYPVLISPQLKKIRHSLSSQLRRRQ